MSDTPRTDAAVAASGYGLTPLMDLARELERELAIAKDAWHMANGTADLAIKHRNEAEADNAALRAALEAECKQPVTIYTTEADPRIKALEAENAVLRADAERYRWLRHGDNDEAVIRFTADEAYVLRNEELDAAIDAARKP